MREEILITDLYEATVEKSNISSEITRDKWRVMTYETAKCKGKLLAANDKCSPPQVKIRLNATGKYAIYLGMMEMRGCPTTSSIRLSDTEERTRVRAMTKYNWSSVETMVEYYWRDAELDGLYLILEKPKDYLPQSSTLAWIRLVPIEDEQFKKTASVAYHFDSDYFADDEYPTPESVAGRIAAVSDGGAELILQETFALSPECEYSPDPVLFPRAAKYAWFHENKKAIEAALIKKAHDMGAEIYAAYRVQAGVFTAPNDYSGINNLFLDNYNELSHLPCVTRDGRALGMCSYAYPEVRKKIVEYIMNICESEFDGVSLLFNRGTFVAFEKPICDRIFEKYGLDARRLPMSDPRYYEVACSFVTEFMRELRQTLDARFDTRKKINVVVFFTPEDSKHFGFDIKGWVDEELVDSVSQGLMTVYENLDGCLDEGGLVDLEKYHEELMKRPIIERKFRVNPEVMELIEEGAREFMKICSDKVDFYATLLWEAQDEDQTVEISDRLKRLGIKKFISWNANHKSQILNRINAEKLYAAGSREEYEHKRSRYYRTLSINGIDLSQFNPNWKG